MPSPVCESISKAVVAKLATITVANGYANTLQSVQRFQQAGMAKLAVPAVLLREGPEHVEEGPVSGGYSLLDCHRTYGLLLFTRADPATETRSGDEVMNSLTADVQVAMLADPTWGKLALDTRETGSQPLEPEAGVPALNRYLEYEVHYRRRRTDPTLSS